MLDDEMTMPAIGRGDGRTRPRPAGAQPEHERLTRAPSPSAGLSGVLAFQQASRTGRHCVRGSSPGPHRRHRENQFASCLDARDLNRGHVERPAAGAACPPSQSPLALQAARTAYDAQPESPRSTLPRRATSTLSEAGTSE